MRRLSRELTVGHRGVTPVGLTVDRRRRSPHGGIDVLGVAGYSNINACNGAATFLLFYQAEA